MPQSLFKALATLPKALPTLLIGLATVLIAIAGCSTEYPYTDTVRLIDSINFEYVGGNPDAPTNGIGTYSIRNDTLSLDFQSFEEAKGAYVSIDSTTNTHPDSFQVIIKRPWLAGQIPSDSDTYVIYLRSPKYNGITYSGNSINGSIDTITLEKNTKIITLVKGFFKKEYNIYIGNSNNNYIFNFSESFFNNINTYQVNHTYLITSKYIKFIPPILLIKQNNEKKYLQYINIIHKHK